MDGSCQSDKYVSSYIHNSKETPGKLLFILFVHVADNDVVQLVQRQTPTRFLTKMYNYILITKQTACN